MTYTKAKLLPQVSASRANELLLELERKVEALTKLVNKLQKDCTLP
jgi:hypothetical protein